MPDAHSSRKRSSWSGTPGRARRSGARNSGSARESSEAIQSRSSGGGSLATRAMICMKARSSQGPQMEVMTGRAHAAAISSSEASSPSSLKRPICSSNSWLTVRSTASRQSASFEPKW